MTVHSVELFEELRVATEKQTAYVEKKRADEEAERQRRADLLLAEGAEDELVEDAA